MIASGQKRGLNKLAWDRREGRQAAIGASDGKVYIYDIGAGMATPRENEWDLLRRTLNGLAAASQDPLAPAAPASTAQARASRGYA